MTSAVDLTIAYGAGIIVGVIVRSAWWARMNARIAAVVSARLGVRSPSEELRKGHDPEAFARGAAEMAPGVEAWRADVLRRAGITEEEAAAGVALWQRMAREADRPNLVERARRNPGPDEPGHEHTDCCK